MRILLIIVLLGIAGWISKIIWKKRLQRVLGRKVSDHELTSITTWMQATPRDERKADGASK